MYSLSVLRLALAVALVSGTSGAQIPQKSNSPTLTVPYQFAQGESAKWECMTEFLVLRWPRWLP